MNLDLDKVQQSLNWLADTAEGDQALEALANAFEALRGRLPSDLNNAEMKYVLERLVEQRSLTDWDKKPEPAEVGGYNLGPFGFQAGTGTPSRLVPGPLSHTPLPVGFGFNLKASISV